MRSRQTSNVWGARHYRASMVTLAVCCALSLAGLATTTHGQIAAPSAESPPAKPEPVYWKQDLFLIPYQWSSAAEPVGAQAVWLFVSKDQGATWRKVSEATPQVKAFNYRAEGDGEYWFAVRTLDKQGRAWPAGPYQPELRVIVDTNLPQIAELWGRRIENGSIEIGWRGSDQNLDPASWKIEAQFDISGVWQTVPVTGVATTDQGAVSSMPAPDSPFHAYWQPPTGSQPLAIRASVLDRAGNSATYQTPITSMPASGASTEPGDAATSGFSGSMPLQGASNLSGWAVGPAAPVPATNQPADQPWLAAVMSRAPFRLSSSTANLQDDGVTTYGSPPSISAAESSIESAVPDRDEYRVESRYAGPVVRGLPDPAQWDSSSVSVVRGAPGPVPSVVRGSPDPAPVEAFGHATGEVGRPAPNENDGPGFKPLEPFREVSVSRLPTPDAGPPQYAPMQPKLVGSRSFALEYDLEDGGRWGVSKVELWGTRDGGQTWHSYARDDDNRSPLIATVDDEGLYGFRITVDSAGSEPTPPPSTGDEPELWVAVDLRRPVVELTAIERGEGNLADHFILRWRAVDDNLESRPIALFYSSRPSGPWSAIATNLEDTGAYAWRIERHVPPRLFLRLEARDTAGNLAAFQTREPVELSATAASGRLLSAEPAGPTAVGSDPSYR